MPGTIKTYDPKKVLVLFGPIAMSGYADGSFVKVARNSPTWKTHTGADGEGARSKSNDRSGKVTVTLMQSSPVNALLSATAAADELANAGVYPLFVKDNSGRSLHAAANAWIEQLPESDYARELGVREWIFASENLQSFDGGSLTT